MSPQIFTAGGVKCIMTWRLFSEYIGQQLRRKNLPYHVSVRKDFAVIQRVVRMGLDRQSYIPEYLIPRRSYNCRCSPSSITPKLAKCWVKRIACAPVCRRRFKKKRTILFRFARGSACNASSTQKSTYFLCETSRVCARLRQRIWQTSELLPSYSPYFWAISGMDGEPFPECLV